MGRIYDILIHLLRNRYIEYLLFQILQFVKSSKHRKLKGGNFMVHFFFKFCIIKNYSG